LRAVDLVFKSRKEYLRSVEMIVCVCKPLNFPEKKSQVVFDASLITYVARLLKVISSSRIFNQSTVNVIFPLFRRAQIPKDDSQLIVEAANDAMILDLLK
jgi:hypothetical protein